MKNSRSLLLILLAPIFLFSCTQNEKKEKDLGVFKKVVNRDFVDGKHFSNDSLYYIDVHLSADSLIGRHCFVSASGNRIDCCEENSIFMKETKQNMFAGFIRDCYSQQKHDVNLRIDNEDFVLYMINNNHEFAPDTIRFN